MSKGEKLSAEAEEKLNKRDGILSTLFGYDSPRPIHRTSNKSQRMEEAAELYSAAGNAFRLENNAEASGKAYTQAGVLFEKLNRGFDAADRYVTASSSLRKLPCQINAYSTAKRCLLNVATISANFEDYPKAIEIYEKVSHQFDSQYARETANDALLKYGAPEYAFKACLCHLCFGDITNARIACDRLALDVPAFCDTRDYTLLCALMEAVDQEDEEGFGDAIAEYDKIKRVDPWTTRLISKFKSSAFQVDLR
ncbi:alpha-soluble NSF attachment protein-like [Octopus sinensis]|uniref:Alpha-soluble NSF attachment protein-like n=1 Tax=Octopus sinensis TaxID=2607531 RepID=A0A6P7U170_9MOLL|nr:alpha-soluble NSF attachment protein-like [Octopus sinensis]